MLTTIRRFFDNCIKPNASDDGATAAHKLHLASAALLVELAAADQNRSVEEQSVLRKIFEKEFHLAEHEVSALEELAHQEAKTATSLYQFTSLINDGFSYAEKIRLLEQLWQVAYADGRLDRYEEHLIRKISDLLYLSHGDFIRAKLASKPR
jgi:uncharacterized tellurite resistance protein B-like protein